jgi:hypothetical protein
MSHNLEAVEATRARFRPDRITTLFVGESAPASGDFFYYGNNAMLRHMQRAVEQALGEGGDFLERFKAYGWYLDDLVLTPVNQLTKAQRDAKCLGAQNSLAARIAEHRPLAIVSLLISIKTIVDAAAIAAGSHRSTICCAVSGNGATSTLPSRYGANYPSASEIAGLGQERLTDVVGSVVLRTDHIAGPETAGHAPRRRHVHSAAHRDDKALQQREPKAAPRRKPAKAYRIIR